jgi:hypothetical protein
MFLTIVLVIVIAVGVFIAINSINAVNAYELLQEYSNQTEFAMTLSIDTELDDHMTHGDITVTKTQIDGHTVTCIQNDGISLYYAEGAVIMENGKSYKVSELYPDYSSLPAETAKIFQVLSFTTSRIGDKVSCTLTAEGENARNLLEILLPEQIDNLSDTQKLTVELTSADNEIQSLCFSSEGTLTDEDKTPYTVSAELKPAEMEKNFTIPEPVKETVCAGETETSTEISDDLFRLLTAWTDISREEAFTADVTLEVECSSISLRERVKYERSIVDGEKSAVSAKTNLLFILRAATSVTRTAYF